MYRSKLYGDAHSTYNIWFQNMDRKFEHHNNFIFRPWSNTNTTCYVDPLWRNFWPVCPAQGVRTFGVPGQLQHFRPNGCTNSESIFKWPNSQKNISSLEEGVVLTGKKYLVCTNPPFKIIMGIHKFTFEESRHVEAWYISVCFGSRQSWW